ncbi:YidC/Oxa1 family membrane protein insertase [Vallitalea pronyensis]|uniref:YidC/Oxa1 family membrane protein insertase n=1 Tax=Vallitalea pronyensis TaxID=1348613 RepID=A0A8J8SF58_9FIRM|nr:YidC/Oxa1 family membrane protein insertase [Vallitalea pronyensis]QUI21087.1 YidC/Oxa1 family membrane protein insertase [Vallitalea pronyensis]
MLSNIFVLTQSTTPITGPIAKVFGMIMNTIYQMFSSIGIESLGISIILFTVIIRILMLPLAFKQQKSMLGMQAIQPKLKKIQDKYKNKKDAESQNKMRMEMSTLYQENNVSPFGGCLPLLVQFPIIMSLFAVLRNIPAYIVNIKNIYLGIIATIKGVPDYTTLITSVNEASKTPIRNFDPMVDDKVVDLLGSFSSDKWVDFQNTFSSVADKVEPMVNQLSDVNYFFGINLADNPDLMSIGLLIPLLNLVVQFLVMKTSQARSAGKMDQKQATTNKTMMYTMPLITVFFVLSMPAGLGLYWLTSSSFQFVQQVIINNHLDKDKKK